MSYLGCVLCTCLLINTSNTVSEFDNDFNEVIIKTEWPSSLTQEDVIMIRFYKTIQV